MNLDFSEEDDAFRREVRQFLADALPERWTGIFHGGDELLDRSFAVTRAMADRGWLTQLWPAEYGGQDASMWRQTVLQEELWAHNEPRGGQYMGVNWIGPSLIRFGTDEQRRRYLPRIAAGDVQWAQLFSEPDAGSDLAALATRAEPAGDTFVINGEKIWTSFGDYAEYGVLVARSMPGSRRQEGLSVLLIEMDTPGIEVRPIETPFGRHELNSVAFTDAAVPASCLLGPLHDGWRVAMAALAFERTGIARYARVARVIGFLERQPGADDPLIRQRLTDALVATRVAELMNYRVIAVREAGEIPTWEGSAARVHNVELEQEVAAIAADLLGTDVLVDVGDPDATEGGELEEFYRLRQMSAVASGALEVQIGIVANRALGMPRAR